MGCQRSFARGRPLLCRTADTCSIVKTAVSATTLSRIILLIEATETVLERILSKLPSRIVEHVEAGQQLPRL